VTESPASNDDSSPPRAKLLHPRGIFPLSDIFGEAGHQNETTAAPLQQHDDRSHVLGNRLKWPTKVDSPFFSLQFLVSPSFAVGRKLPSVHGARSESMSLPFLIHFRSI
jgi:hypothetical protein